MKCSGILSLAFVCGILSIQGCKTLQSAMGKASFEPASYGTSALVDVIRNPQSTKTDAIVAAEALRDRSIAAIPEERFERIITNEALQPDARVIVIEMLNDLGLAQFKEAFRKAAIESKSPRVAEKAGIAYYVWATSFDEQEAFLLETLNTSDHGLMRARAARALKEQGPQYLDVLLKRLKTETSAPAAYAICEALTDYQTIEAIEALESIANNVDRKFESGIDPHTNDEVTAEQLRIYCVSALEQMSAALY